MNEIANEMTLSEIPLPEAPWDELQAFANTFRPIALNHSLNKIQEMARLESGISLEKLRARLYLMMEMGKHTYDFPDLDDMAEVRDLIRKIRQIVSSQSFS